MKPFKNGKRKNLPLLWRVVPIKKIGEIKNGRFASPESAPINRKSKYMNINNIIWKERYIFLKPVKKSFKWFGFVLQESRQETTKVVPLCKKWLKQGVNLYTLGIINCCCWKVSLFRLVLQNQARTADVRRKYSFIIHYQAIFKKCQII